MNKSTHLGLIFSLSLMLADGVMAQSGAFDQLLNDYWNNELAENPVSATYAGVDGYNHKLSAITPADYQRRAEQSKVFKQRLQAIGSASLSEGQQVSYQVLEFVLKHEVILAAFDSYRIPILSDTGFHTNFNGVAAATPLRNEQDYRNYIKRLQALPGFLQQNIDNMRQGMQDGFTQPRAILDNMRSAFADQVTKTAQTHPLYAPFTRIPSSIAASVATELQNQGQQVLTELVIPKFKVVNDFFQNEYIPGARESFIAIVRFSSSFYKFVF